MKTNIALIGFMGTGKTVVGKALAKKLSRKFVELDLLIERKAGKPIPVIFEEDGEIAFLELEIEATKEVSQEEKAVIACGGGIVLNQINIDRLKQQSRIVYLTASTEVILRRIGNSKDERPLLNVADPALTIGELLRYRKPFYERGADIKIDTSKWSVDEVVQRIIKKVEGCESISS